jgi:hypothetical protein
VERESAKGGALFYITVEAEFDFVSAEDGSKHTVRTFGEAMDRGDKATNKAMSAAYKYAAFQAFAIPTEGDNDADAQTHEVKPTPIRANPMDGVQVTHSHEKHAVIVQEHAEAEDYAGAWEYINRQGWNADDKAAVWSLLPSNVRSALKKAHKEAA